MLFPTTSGAFACPQNFARPLTRVLLPLLAIATLGLSACDDDDPQPENEEELITTVIVTLTPSAGGNPVALTWRDPDGPGGDVPTVVGGVLASGQRYATTVALLNESETPTDDITAEVREEGDEHQVFFVADGFNLVYTYGDADGDGRPIGLVGTLVATGSGSQLLTVILRHEPNKSAAGVANGDPTNAGGETDIEVGFPVTIL